MVWEAHDRDLGREVALKAVGPGGRSDLRGERLLLEAEAAARLSHPNIVTLFDAGRSEQGPYLVLELLRGETLAKRLDQGPITVWEALRVAVEVAKGLAHAHEHGVVHRDLTPGNVFLWADGQVKVLDLGMAHAFGKPKAEGGTRAYMAPEQAAGAPEDERTDVFALGVVLYRMLSGKLPFPEATNARARHIGSPPSLEVQDVPALAELVGKMLSKDPVKRPRNAGEVLAAFTAFQSELSHSPPTASVVRVRHRSHTRTPRALPTPSIAVLPFADLSPHHDVEEHRSAVTALLAARWRVGTGAHRRRATRSPKAWRRTPICWRSGRLSRASSLLLRRDGPTAPRIAQTKLHTATPLPAELAAGQALPSDRVSAAQPHPLRKRAVPARACPPRSSR